MDQESWGCPRGLIGRGGTCRGRPVTAGPALAPVALGQVQHEGPREQGLGEAGHMSIRRPKLS